MAIRQGKKKAIAPLAGPLVPTPRQPGKILSAAVFETVGISTLQRTVIRDCDCSIRASTVREFSMDLQQRIGRPFEFQLDLFIRTIHSLNQDVDLLQVVFLGLVVDVDSMFRIRAALDKSFDCRTRIQRPTGGLAATRQTIFNYLVREDHVIQT